MSTDTKRIVAEAAAGALADVLDQQPWYRARANTVVAACSGVATMATWLATTELGLPDPVRIGAGLLAAAAGVLATRRTTNGTTIRGSQAVIDATVDRVTDALTPRGATLDDLVTQVGQTAADAAARAARDAATAAITGSPAAVPGAVIGSAVGSAEAWLDLIKRGAR